MTEPSQKSQRYEYGPFPQETMEEKATLTPAGDVSGDAETLRAKVFSPKETSEYETEVHSAVETLSFTIHLPVASAVFERHCPLAETDSPERSAGVNSQTYVAPDKDGRP